MRPGTGQRWRWSNVPVPEPHVAGVLVGTVAHVLWPKRLFARRRLARVSGWVLVWVGLLGIARSVRTVGALEVEKPTALVTSGPYASSRNPMYVAWTAVYLGIALVLNALWLFVVFPVVVAVTHRVVRAEERALEHAFGDEYRAYRRTVPRYL